MAISKNPWLRKRKKTITNSYLPPIDYETSLTPRTNSQGNVTRKCDFCRTYLPVRYFGGYLVSDKNKRKRNKCVQCTTLIKEGKFEFDILEKDITDDQVEAATKRIKANRVTDQRHAVERNARAVIRSQRAKLEAKQGPDIARREMAARILSKRKLIHFICRFNKEYMPGWVHVDICDRLERFMKAVENKESPRLMLFQPPRSGKSEIASINFPAYALGHHPEWEFIAASYAVSLPLRFSKKVRAMVRSKEYRVLFPHTTLDQDSQSAEFWLTTKNGGLTAAGVGGGISGKGAHCLPLSSLILTPHGPMSLKRLVQDGGKVLSYDFSNKKLVTRSIYAAATREVERYYRIGCSTGLTFSATGEHPVCVGYTEAGAPAWGRVDELRVGTRLTQVREKAVQDMGEVSYVRGSVYERVGEVEEKPQPHMLQRVFGGISDQGQPSEIGVRGVRGRVYSRQVGNGSQKEDGASGSLFGELQLEASVKGVQREESSKLQFAGGVLRKLQDKICSVEEQVERVAWEVSFLFQRLLFRVAEGPTLSKTRCTDGAGISSGVQKVAGDHASWFVRGLRGGGERYTSPGLRQGEQLSGESSFGVQVLSHEASSSEIVTNNYVTSIDLIEESITVGDIQVPGTHNFILDSFQVVHNCLIVDDPVKDSTEAESETTREATWDWWQSTAKTRLSPGGGVLVIQTRWNDDDLSGRLLKQMTDQTHDARTALAQVSKDLSLATGSAVGQLESEIATLRQELGDIERWEVVSYPALAEADEWLNNVTHEIVRDPTEEEREATMPSSKPTTPLLSLLRKKGEALHPERFPESALRRIRKSTSPRYWSAMYQQNPVPDDGAFFTQQMFRWGQKITDFRHMKLFATWDLAIGKGEQNDYTVGVVGAVDPSGIIHMLAGVRGRLNTYEIVDAVLNMFVRFPETAIIGIEKGQLELAVKPVLKQQMKDRRLFPTLAEGKNALNPVTDKERRASPLQGLMQQGMVVFPKGDPFFTWLLTEMLRFPVGTHDDGVDAMAWMARLVLSNPLPKDSKRGKKTASWRDRLQEFMAKDGRATGHMAA